MSVEISLAKEDGIAWIGVSPSASPTLTPEFCAALIDVFDRIEAVDDLKCIVLSGAPKGFVRGFAGTDFHDLGVYEQGRALLSRIENCPLPVIAVIPDGAINEGLELAMAAHYRVAGQNARFAMTHITTGGIAGMGGTQRLPRLTGAKVALEMMLNGKMVTAEAAKDAGLIDHVAGREFAKDVRAYVEELAAGDLQPRPTKDMIGGRTGPERYQSQMNEARKMVANYALPAARSVVDCVEAAQVTPLSTGLVIEKSKFEQCRNSDGAFALRHVAQAEHRLNRPGPRSNSTVNVVVIAANGSDAGLCVALLDAGLNVIVVDQYGPPHPSMSGAIISIYDKAVQLGRMPPEIRASRVARLDVVQTVDEILAADVIIDAGHQYASEVLDFMRSMQDYDTQLFLTARLDDEAAELAELVADICPVAGFAFPREPHIAKVVEVYGLEGQPPSVLQDAAEFFRVAKRMPVMVEEGVFKLATQMRAVLMESAETLLLHGAEPRQIDEAMVGFGFRLGPLAMRDEVGIEADLVKGQQPASEALLASGRKGRSTGLGYFRYAKGDPRPRADGVVVWTLSSAREKMGITPIEFSDHEIICLIVGALANFGAEMLDVDAVQRASDLDVLAIHSIGFPRRTGGPMQAAEQLGLFELQQVLERFTHLNARLWTPHNLIVDLVKYGQGFENMDLPDLDRAS